MFSTKHLKTKCQLRQSVKPNYLILHPRPGSIQL